MIPLDVAIGLYALIGIVMLLRASLEGWPAHIAALAALFWFPMCCYVVCSMVYEFVKSARRQLTREDPFSK